MILQQLRSNLLYPDSTLLTASGNYHVGSRWWIHGVERMKMNNKLIL